MTANGTYKVSMKEWLEHPKAKKQDQWEAKTGYKAGPGLWYGPNSGDLSLTQSINLSLPEQAIAKLANGQGPSNDYYFYLWNGIDFNLSLIDNSLPSMNQIFQPVLWKGKGSIARPYNNLYPGYAWIYDDESGQTMKSEAWLSKDLGAFKKYNFPADVNLHYFENNTWKSVNSLASPSLFDQKLDSSEILFNSQYINFTPNFFDGQHDSQLWVLSEDIISVPSTGASVQLTLEIPEDGNSITIKGKTIIPGIDPSSAPQSILKIDEIYSPLTKEWDPSNVFRTIPLAEIGNIWNAVNYVYPFLGETYAFGSTEEEALRATTLMGELLDGLIIEINLEEEPSFSLINQNKSNPVLKTDKNSALIGTSSDDKISGGANDDLILGGLGNDLLTGGDGADIFKFEPPKNSGDNYKDQITDFSQEEGDKIDISDAIEEGSGNPFMLIKNQIGFSESGTTIKFNSGLLQLSGESEDSGNFEILIPGLESINIDMFVI